MKPTICAALIIISTLFSSSFCQIRSFSPNTTSELDRLLEFIRFGPANIFWRDLNDLNKKDISPPCLSALREVLRSQQQGKQWAYQMLDANVGSLNGILSSVYFHPGDYDQCVQISAVNFTDQLPAFVGKYFLMNILPKPEILDFRGVEHGLSKKVYRNMQNSSVQSRLGVMFRYSNYYILKVGICMPSVCTDRDLNEPFDQVFDDYGWSLVNMTEGDTYETFSESANRLEKKHPIPWFLLRAYLFLILSLTALDFLSKYLVLPGLQKPIELISIRCNLKKLFRPMSNNDIKNGLLDSVRFVTVFMVIAYHVLPYVAANRGLTLYSHLHFYIDVTDTVWGQILMTDAGFPLLFTMASATTSAKMYKILKNQPTIKTLVNVVLTRFLKYAPVFAIMILVEICLPYFYTGPLVKDLSYAMSDNCAQRWWKNLLFISNFDHPHQICFLHTWSAIAEFQLLILSCILTYVYSRNPAFGIALNLILIIGSVLSNALIVFLTQGRALIFQMPVDMDDFVDYGRLVHLNTCTHVYSYFMVYLATYFGEHLSEPPFTLKTRTIIGKVVTFYFYCTTLLGALYYVFDIPSQPWLNTIVFTVNRLSLPLAFSWLVFLFRNLNDRPHLLHKEWIVALTRMFLGMKKHDGGLHLKSSDYSENKNLEKSIADIDAQNNNLSNLKEKKLPKRASYNQILFRLMPCFYLSHHFILMSSHFYTRIPLSSTLLSLGGRVVSILASSLPTALLFYLFIEAPVSNVVSILTQGLHKK